MAGRKRDAAERAYKAQQAATAAILKVIQRSPSDAQPVFDAIVRHAARLCESDYSNVFRYDGERLHLGAHVGGSARAVAALRKTYPSLPDRKRAVGRVILTRRVVRIEDTLKDKHYDKVFARVLVNRRLLAVPLLLSGRLLGAITVGWAEPGPILRRHEDLLKTFADQAVIAIENARLFNETKEALERQTATADVLKVISGSPTDVQPVLDSIAERAAILCQAKLGFVARYDGRLLHMSAFHGASERGLKTMRAMYPMDPRKGASVAARVIRAGGPVQVADVLADKAYSHKAAAKDAGFRAVLGVPLLRKGRFVGAIIVARGDPRTFPEKQVELLQTFADQAVIAIENTRLFNETKEALEQQTATADILKVISGSPTKTQPVFDAIVQSAARLFPPCEVVLSMREGDAIHGRARAGHPLTKKQFQQVARVYPMALDPSGGPSARAILGRRVIEIMDTEGPAAGKISKHIARVVGFRSVTVVPLMREGEAIGTISLTWAEPGRRLAEKQLELLKTFADQAVIAIQNARLFNETQESLERQTATAEILKVISGSPTDVQPAFDAIVQSASHLFGRIARIRVVEDGKLVMRARSDRPRVGGAADEPMPIDRSSIGGRVAIERKAIQVGDTHASKVPSSALLWGRKAGYRAIAAAPLMRKKALIGVMSVVSPEPGTLTDRQMDLLQTFADQAVIAIENARLFNETKEALERQTATAEVLKVIAASPADVQPVFDAIVRTGVRLFAGLDVSLRLIRGGRTQTVASTLPLKTEADAHAVSLEDEGSPSSLAIRRRDVVQVADMRIAAWVNEKARQRAEQRGFSAIATAPILKDGDPIGVISVMRAEPGRFTERDVSLLKTFADQAVIAIENVRLFNETKDALERQTATGEILASISSSIDSAQPVFDAIVRNVRRLFGTAFSAVFVARGDKVDIAALSGEEPFISTVRKAYPHPLDDEEMVVTRVIRGAEVVRLCPVVGNPAAPKSARLGKAAGYNSLMTAPILRGGVAIGAIATAHTDAIPFDDRQVALVKSFADQAGIAIENARLFNETKEGLERQTATAEILKVISGSPGDLRPVFDAIIRNAIQLAGGFSAVVTRSDGEKLHLEAFISMDPAKDDSVRAHFPLPIEKGTAVGDAIIRGEVSYVPDALDDQRQTAGARALAVARGYRSLVHVPMKRHGEVVGGLHVTHKKPGAFSRHHIDLLQTFADQAVIAIENARLFNETREALERQTATAEILRVIASSPSDVQPVLDTVAEAAARLCETDDAIIRRVEPGGLRRVAHFGPLPESAESEIHPIVRDSVGGRAVIDRSTIHIEDSEEAFRDKSYAQARALWATAGKYRSMLAVPLVREATAIGVIMCRRSEKRPFTERQIALLKTFADQAVIAIENVRLFNETKEALERQTASADILKVIASSPTDVQPVFDAIVDAAHRLIPGKRSGLLLAKESHFEVAASSQRGVIEHLPDQVRNVRLDRDKNFPSRAILDGEVVHIPDWQADDIPEFEKTVARTYGVRSGIIVPLLRNGRGIGALSVTRATAGPYHDKEIALLRSFADQAVIAIENTRLFNETKESLERQTATAEILKVIASSPSDVQPVFDAIAQSARRLLDGGAALVARREGDTLHLAAYTKTNPAGDAALQGLFPSKIVGRGHMGKAILSRGPLLISDIETDPDYSEGFKAMARSRNLRSIVTVPMLREGEAIGVISVNRPVAGKFSEHQTNLLRTFADQAVIAIENVRLFNETKEALERQTASGEVLRVISGTPADAQPVFDAIAQSALRVFNVSHVGINVVEGDVVKIKATGGSRDPRGELAIPIDRNSTAGRAILDRALVKVEDTESPDTATFTRDSGRLVGFRAIATAPMLYEGAAVGSVSMMRKEPGAFGEKQLELLQTFADQAVIAIQNARLFNETKESLERQTATAEILRVISSSPTDVQPVYEAIVASALRLVGAYTAVLTRLVDEKLHLAAYTTVRPEADEGLKALFPIAVEGETTAIAQAIRNKSPRIVADTETDESLSKQARESARARGYRSILHVPMLREGTVVGGIHVTRIQPGEFADHEVALIQTFADQAVIAIENVRLFNETKEALEQQTATGEILKVISSSPTDVQPVFESIVSSAAQLLAPCRTGIQMREGEEIYLRATAGHPPELSAELRALYPVKLDPKVAASAQAILEQRVIECLDTEADGVPDIVRKGGRIASFRSITVVPLIRDNEGIGALTLSHPQPGFRLSEKQLQLMRTFADQAVIAIENVRLFNETKEALERQTASAEILKVISSSPTNVQPVLEAIIQSAVKLFAPRSGSILMREGETMVLGPMAGPLATTGNLELVRSMSPFPLDPEQLFTARAIVDGVVTEILDMQAEDTPEAGKRTGRALGYRTQTNVPLMRGGVGIGVIALAHPEPHKPLTPKELELVKTFADQAVIAIENVRLFNETREALEQQTAISEILRVISSSPSDVKPVLDAVAVRAARICDASDARIFLVEGEDLRYAAGFGDVPLGSAIGDVIPLTRGGITGRAIIDHATMHIEDMLAQSEEEFPVGRAAAVRRGWRTALAVPLMREQRPLGGIILRRKEVRLFSEKQVALLKTFADQAAIAIENVRLFNAIKEALEQQTATAEVLNVISSSITDARPVFDAIARSALNLYGARAVTLVIKAGDRIERVGRAIADQSADDSSATLWPIPLDDKSMSGRAIVRDELVHIRDVETEPGLSEQSRAISRNTGARSVLAAPMHSMGVATGALVVGRRAPGGFSEREVELIRTFADQAVIAMENARLFREIEEKSAQLEVASAHKSQFLASMSHELRTPLNALLGFNEMILGDIYGEVPGDMRAPLLQMQTSGKHLLRLINNVLDLAKIEAGRMELVLADYSVQDTVEGVRSTLRPLAAEKGLEFLAAVPADIPLAHGDGGRITQCLMNLAGNSLKFTKSGKVEISVAADNGLLRYRVSDTGIGIPADKIESLFTEFKQTDATIASEYGGTGLGLAISKKFVEMHGGRIWVESEPGKGSVFTFEVPLQVRSS